MFTLVKMKDAIPIPADKLDKPRAIAVSHQIEEKYCNRVLLDIGLCICLYEMLELGDGLIYQSDASVHVRATFTLLVFRPFNGEVLVGTVHKSTPQGLWISVGFFQDIHVPSHLLPEGSEWDQEQELWVWKSEYGDAEISDVGPIRFRVNTCTFREVMRPLHAPPAANAESNHVSGSGEDGDAADETPPMKVSASIKDDGLGMVLWWDGKPGAEDEEIE